VATNSWNLEWLNLNANRSYPFHEDTTRMDSTGAVTIPDSLIVDLAFTLPADVSDTYHLSKVVFSGSSLTLIISDDAPSIVTSITVDMGAHTTNDGYNLIGQGDYTDARGRIALGDLTNLHMNLIEGIYEFTPESTVFESSVVRPDIRAVRALRVINAGGGASEDINGVIELIAGSNVRLVYVPATSTQPAGIRIDAISGEGLNQECECDKMYVPPPAIRTINGVAADGSGDFAIESPDGCLQISPALNGIEFDDKCSKPCCGCVELAFIQSNLNSLSVSTTTLASRADLLESNQINFYNNVLGSS